MAASFRRIALLTSPLLVVFACATAEDDATSGGPGSSTGGTASGSGGSAMASGGSASASGGSATGGLGGATASGGSAAGGSPAYDGDCADKPTADDWRGSSSKATGDAAIHQCPADRLQAACAGLEANTDYLFECTATHLPNCDQSPADGDNWKFLVECGDIGVGGAGGDGAI